MLSHPLSPLPPAALLLRRSLKERSRSSPDAKENLRRELRLPPRRPLCKARTLIPEPRVSRLRKHASLRGGSRIFPLSGTAPEENREESPSIRKERGSFQEPSPG